MADDITNEVYCDGRCDEMGCRGHDVLQFKDCPERADDQAELLAALFAEVERLRSAVDEEREACAKLAEDEDGSDLLRCASPDALGTAEEIAKRIRARGAR